MDYLILALATWRISHIAAFEDGPYLLVDRLRLWIEREHEQLNALITCIWCSSVWVGVFWALLYALSDKSVYLALPFALSGGAIAVDEIIGRVKNG